MEDMRDFIREEKFNERKSVRESLLNRNRSVENVEISNITRTELIKKANELKQKSLVTPNLLSLLRDAFMQDKENINIFLSVDGALHALIRALSGKDANFQIKAAYCLCNLALYNEKRSLQIIQTAGPYLMLHLEGMNNYLIEQCAWTIGNLASHGEKCVTLLKTQGAFSNLVRLLSHNEENVRISVLYALNHLVYNGFDTLEPSDFQILLQPVLKLLKNADTSSAFLMWLLSSVPHCQLTLLQEGVHVTALCLLLNSLESRNKFCILYLRTICNLINETSGDAALQLINHTLLNGNTLTKTFHKCLQYLLNSNEVYFVKESFWLLGNLLNHANPNVQELLINSGLLKDFAILMSEKKNAVFYEKTN